MWPCKVCSQVRKPNTSWAAPKASKCGLQGREGILPHHNALSSGVTRRIWIFLTESRGRDKDDQTYETPLLLRQAEKAALSSAYNSSLDFKGNISRCSANYQHKRASCSTGFRHSQTGCKYCCYHKLFLQIDVLQKTQWNKSGTQHFLILKTMMMCFQRVFFFSSRSKSDWKVRYNFQSIFIDWT